MVRVPALALLACLVLAAPRPAWGAVTVYPVHGSPDDFTGPSHGPGLIVMGGGSDVDEAFVWMHKTITGDPAANGGDVVVFRAAGGSVRHDDDYAPYIIALAPFHSVRTIVLSSPPAAADVAAAVPYIDHAEAVFFAGGDQSDYVGWRGDLLAAVQRAYDRGAVVGGTSAGADILGQFVNDAVGELDGGVTQSPDAIADPFEPSITLSQALFKFAPLGGSIVDTHFRTRDRFGRLAAYMARIVGGAGGPSNVVGIGVDESSALVVDGVGKATLMTYQSGPGAAWILRGGQPSRLAAGQPLAYAPLTVTRLDLPGGSVDLTQACGTGQTYEVSVDGSQASPYVPFSPYDGTGAVSPCSGGGAPPGTGAAPDAGGAAPSDTPGAPAGCACSSVGRERPARPALGGALAFLAFAGLTFSRRARRRRAAAGTSPS